MSFLCIIRRAQYKNAKSQLEQGLNTIKTGSQLKENLSTRNKQAQDVQTKAVIDGAIKDTREQISKQLADETKARADDALAEARDATTKELKKELNAALKENIENELARTKSIEEEKENSEQKTEETEEEIEQRVSDARQSYKIGGALVQQGISEGDDAKIVIGGIKMLATYKLLNSESGFAKGVDDATNVALSGMRLAEAVSDKDAVGIVSNGIELLSDVDALLGEDSLGIVGDLADIKLTDDLNLGSTIQGITSAVNLYNAIDDGNVLGAVQSTYGIYNTFFASSSGSLPGTEILGYAQAIVQLIDGDVVGAAISAASAYLATFVPFGTIAAIALQLLGGMLVAPPPDPEASLDFARDGDSFASIVEFNETGQGLGSLAQSTGDAFIKYLNNLEDTYAVGLEINGVRVIDFIKITGTDNGVSLKGCVLGNDEFKKH